MRKHEVIVLAIVPFVGIYIYKVINAVRRHSGKQFPAISDMQPDPLFQTCLGEPFENEVFEFVIQFKGVENAAFRKGRCKADCGIAGESAEFEYMGSPAHKHCQTEQLALYGAGQHTGVIGPYVGLLFQPGEGFGGSCTMVRSISVDFFHINFYQIQAGFPVSIRQFRQHNGYFLPIY